jgi:hypothetical protein
MLRLGLAKKVKLLLPKACFMVLMPFNRKGVCAYVELHRRDLFGCFQR